MKEVYLLIPLLTSANPRLEPDIESTLAISPQEYELYQFDQHKYAVELHSLNLGYQELTETLQEHSQLKDKLALLERNLKEYDWSSRDVSIQASSMDSLVKKAMKYRELKEENKKLKKLLQNQLENTEKVREETQKTMKVLRQEFDTLVREMNRQVAERDKPPGGESSRVPPKHPKHPGNH